MNKTLIRLSAIASIVFLVNACGTENKETSLNSGNSPVVVKDGHATGAKLPSEEELLRIRKGMNTIINVRPNQIWKSRLSGKDVKSLSLSKGTPGAEVDTVPALSYDKTKGASKSVVKTTTELPKQVNNSLLNAFPPIGNQGGIGSCATFSTTYYTMTHEVGLRYGINNKGGVGSPGNKIFTPRWTYNMINGGGDWGSWMTTSNEVMSQVGCATWDEFAYDGDGSNPINYLEWCLNTNTWRNAMKYRVSSQGTIPVTDNLSEIKGYLANGHVVTFATGVFSWHYQQVLNNTSSTLDDSYVGKSAMIYMDQSNYGGHSMTVAGYNDDVWVDINNDGQQQPAELGIFIIANSWGNYGEDNGFLFVTYDSVRLQSTAGLTASDRIPALWSNEFYYIDVQQYNPTYILQFTVGQEQRNQLYVTYSDANSGTEFYTPFHYSGGAYSFAGNNTPVDGTFMFDVSSFITSSSSAASMNIWDGYTGYPTTVKNVSLIDVANNNSYQNSSLPQTLDGSSNRYRVDFSSNNIPNAPTNLGTSVLGTSQIQLTWNDASNNEDGFRVYISTSTTKPANATAVLGSNTAQYTFSSLNADTTYNMWVEAYNTSGTSSAPSATAKTAYDDNLQPLVIDDFNSAARWSSRLNDIDQPIQTNGGMYNLEGNMNLYFFYNGGYTPESFDMYLNRDISLYKYVTLTIKGDQGGEESSLRLVLNDGSFHAVAVVSYGSITTSYKEISIPLSDLGANLANAKYLRIEGTGTAKVVRIDEIKLTGKSEPIYDDFGCVKESSSTAKFYYNLASTWVDLHFVMDGLQQNLQMQKNANGKFEYIASGVTSGKVISYFFTYEKNGLAFDTTWKTFVMP